MIQPTPTSGLYLEFFEQGALLNDIVSHISGGVGVGARGDTCRSINMEVESLCSKVLNAQVQSKDKMDKIL